MAFLTLAAIGCLPFPRDRCRGLLYREYYPIARTSATQPRQADPRAVSSVRPPKGRQSRCPRRSLAADSMMRRSNHVQDHLGSDPARPGNHRDGDRRGRTTSRNASTRRRRRSGRRITRMPTPITGRWPSIPASPVAGGRQPESGDRVPRRIWQEAKRSTRCATQPSPPTTISGESCSPRPRPSQREHMQAISWMASSSEGGDPDHRGPICILRRTRPGAGAAARDPGRSNSLRRKQTVPVRPSCTSHSLGSSSWKTHGAKLRGGGSFSS